VQEVLRLLCDQSFTMSDPRRVTAQLDGLVSAAEQTERGVREMEGLLSGDQDMALAGSFVADVEAELKSLSGGLGLPDSEETEDAPPAKHGTRTAQRRSR